jgi:hypothetical protein
VMIDASRAKVASTPVTRDREKSRVSPQRGVSSLDPTAPPADRHRSQTRMGNSSLRHGCCRWTAPPGTPFEGEAPRDGDSMR